MKQYEQESDSTTNYYEKNNFGNCLSQIYKLILSV